MKYRSGFVSNSSSSSFFMFGVCLDHDDKIFEKLRETISVDEDEDFTNYELLENVFDGTSYQVKTPYGNAGEAYIGKEIDQMDLDETKREFQNKIKKDLTERLSSKSSKKFNFGWFSESWFDG